MNGMPKNSLSDIICVHWIAVFLLHLGEEQKGKGSQCLLCAHHAPGTAAPGGGIPLWSRPERCVQV